MMDYALFGLGGRRKLVFRGGVLRDALGGGVVKKFDRVESIRIQPDCGRAAMRSPLGTIELCEDEQALWLIEDGQRTVLAEGPVSLPTFAGHRHAATLRALLREILLNIVGGAPLPNLLVYRRPWYRDSAMVCMVLAETGNLHLVRDWILSLRDPFDRNNAGQEEPDNLGQLLYMISLVADASHPLVPVVLEQAERFRQDNHLCGNSDFAPHPVYQTKWLKFGLKRLGLEDSWRIPPVADSYSSLFWWDYVDRHVPVERFDARDARHYPYLSWAEAHFYRDTPPPIRSDWPLSWEAHASQADYDGMRLVSEADAQARICRPHTWHAAEMFLYLLEGAREVSA